MDIVDAIFTWLKLPLPREQRRFLEEHLELLDPQSDGVIQAIMEHYQPVQVQDLLDHLTLLHDVRARGNTGEAIRSTYVNLYGGFALDLPSWLEVVEQHLEALDISADSAAERVALLSQALARAQTDSTVLPEMLAELQKELGKAWYERDSLEQKERTQALETAFAYYRTALRIYTSDRYPYCYAKIHIHLGDAYSDRIAGKRRDNLEEAITCYTIALETYTLDRFPEYYAMAQNNLGGAYAARVAGEQRTNRELAIACYQAALQVYTLEGYPEDYAMAQGNLGSLYAERIEGEGKNNLEQAIICYEAALQVYTLDTFPADYAHTHVRLGNAYTDRISGERKANVERGIAYYTEALRVYTLETFPVDYARTQLSLGIAYSYRIAGERRANLEQALACYEAASQVYTYEAFPLSWAAVQNGLGNIYRERVAGSPRANLEQAIACYEAALQVYTYEDFPDEWAATQRGLGSVYSGRIAGEPRTNLEQAIACCEKALTVYTYEAFPYDWAITQNGLGTVYRDRIVGEQEANLEQAIACFEAALRVFTREALPLKWADTHNNLGTTYLRRIAGERRENLEEAIHHCEAALQVYSQETLPLDWAHTQNNRANAYAVRIEGERRANLEQALACYEAALQVFTHHDLPVNYAMIQNNRGIVYSRRIEGEKQANLTAANSCYREALEIYTLEASPYEHWKTQLHLALSEAELGHWEKMHLAYEQAAAAEELLVHLGTGIVGRDSILKEGHNAAARHAYALIRLGQIEKAVVVLERGRARGLAEALMIDAAHPERIQDTERRQRYSESRQTLREAQAQLNHLLTLQVNESELRRINLEYAETYHQAQVTFEKIVDEIREAEDPADFLVEALDHTTLLRAAECGGVGHALVYLAATPGGGMAVAVTSDKSSTPKEPFLALDLPELTENFVRGLLREELEGPGQPVVNSFSLAQSGNGFEQMMRDWKGETFRKRVMVLHETCTIAGRTSTVDQAAQEVVNDPLWAELVDAPLDQLSSADMRRLKYEIRHRLLRYELKRCLRALTEVALRPLIAWLLEHHVSSCILIPCGWLAAFPLLAAEITPGQTMGDIFVSSMAPNARSLLQEQARGISRSGVYSLGNPEPRQNPLRWGEAEALAVAAVARHHKLPREVQIQERATRRWLLKALQKGYVVSASCHGIFDLNVPLQSALLLARGERLTLGEMLNREANLRGLRLLILSACQTALLDLEGAREEVRSLAAGMLQAGAKAILASLWLVDDMATFLLMTRFAQEWLPNMDTQPPAAALAWAQRWLRQATQAELLHWQVRILSLPTSEELLETNATLPVTEEKDADKLLSISAGVSEKSSERGIRYPLDEAESHLHEYVREGKPDTCPFADPIYWAGFQIIGW